MNLATLHCQTLGAHPNAVQMCVRGSEKYILRQKIYFVQSVIQNTNFCFCRWWDPFSDPCWKKEHALHEEILKCRREAKKGEREREGEREPKISNLRCEYIITEHVK
jgi:hypothetical protein